MAAGTPLPDEVADDPSSAAPPPLPTGQAAVLNAMENSPIAAELLGPAMVEALIAVRRYELKTYGERPLAETCQALRLAWSC